jgi:hypothetical protein
MRYVDITVAHVRIGWEKSPDNTTMGIPWARFHCLAADHNRIDAQGKLNKFKDQVSPVEEIRGERIGKTQSGLYIIFQTLDTPKSLEWIHLEKIGRNIIMDYRLCERLSGDVLKYLNSIYNFRELKELIQKPL